jgi:hypothetical protein
MKLIKIEKAFTQMDPTAEIQRKWWYWSMLQKTSDQVGNLELEGYCHIRKPLKNTSSFPHVEDVDHTVQI